MMILSWYVTLWAVWAARRKAIYENKFQPPMSTHIFVDNFIGELHAISKKVVQANMQNTGWLPWTLPPVGFDKFNVDAVVAR